MAKTVSDKDIIRAYSETGSVWRCAAIVGLCGQTVHERLVRLGVDRSWKPWSESETDRLSKVYSEYAGAGKLSDLAKLFGRHKTSLCKKAKELGLTDQKRPKPYMSELASERQRAWLKNNPHPRGAKGIKHSAETRLVISQKSKKAWAQKTNKEIEDWVMKGAKTRERNGTKPGQNREKASWKAGWRDVGGQKCYFRSRWEANYARYLQFLVGNGDISGWLHEEDTFWFEGIRRGCVSYLPDFKVFLNDGSVEYHEVKGWMDSRSKTKINRMAKYHPNVRLIVVDKKPYMEIKRKLGSLIPGWEA